MNKAKILIVEDEAAIAGDLSDILSLSGYEIAGIAHSYKKALYILNKQQVDLALLDISLHGEGTGIDLANVINDKYKIPFIFITSFSDDETIEEVVSTKPKGYLVKPYKEEDINPIVRIALMLSNPSQNNALPSLEEFNNRSTYSLSKQEYKVLALIWDGKKSKEIADQLFVSINTIKTHISRIYHKVGVRSRVQLMKKMIAVLGLDL